MDLLPNCLSALRFPTFWTGVDEPSLKNFLDFRLSAGDLQDEVTEHSRYLSELMTIGRHHAEVSEIGRAALKWKDNYQTTWSHKKRSIEVLDDDDSVVNASKPESEEENVSDVPINSFGDDNEEVNEESNGRSEFTALDRARFSKQFKLLITEKKWKLRSGRYVEDIMYKLGERCNYHHLVHSFIFDTEDKFTCSAFTQEELEEICTTNLRDLPDLEPELLSYISTFAKTSTQDIREEFNRPHVNLGREYNPS